MQDLGQETDGSLLEVAHHAAQWTIPFDGHHLLDAVQGGPGLLDGLHAAHRVDVPGQVAAFVGGDGALDVGAGEHRDERVHGVGADRLGKVGLDVTGVLLGAHAVVAEQVAQGDGVGQVVPQLGGWRGTRRYGGQTDEILGHTDQGREHAVEAVLHHELGHDLPPVPGRGVGIVGAVDLEDPGPGHDLLRLTGIDIAAVGVDVAVQHVVLRILVGTVDAFLGEQDGHLRPGDTRDV